jgi:hypothetical protein
VAVTAGRCLWCDKKLESEGQGTPRLFCDGAHRARFKRKEKAATWADLVESLEPHVKVSGRGIYREMVDRLAGSLNEGAAP